MRGPRFTALVILVGALACAREPRHCKVEAWIAPDQRRTLYMFVHSPDDEVSILDGVTVRVQSGGVWSDPIKTTPGMLQHHGPYPGYVCDLPDYSTRELSIIVSMPIGRSGFLESIPTVIRVPP